MPVSNYGAVLLLLPQLIANADIVFGKAVPENVGEETLDYDSLKKLGDEKVKALMAALELGGSGGVGNGGEDGGDDDGMGGGGGEAPPASSSYPPYIKILPSPSFKS